MSLESHHGEVHGSNEAVEVHSHPQPSEYVKIALILVVITAVEVALYYLEHIVPLAIPLILILSTLKFVVVVGWYMHLKFDAKLFSYLFIGGLALAGLVLLALQFLMPLVTGEHPEGR